MWGEHHSMMWDGHDSWSQGMLGGGWVMLFGLILATVLVVLLVVFLVRQTTHPSGYGPGIARAPQGPPPTLDQPREILKRRYASGEIDREEYFQRLGDL